VVDRDVDVLIVGGGFIGAILMLSLAATGIRCLLVDNQALSDRIADDFDARSLALSAASVRILRMLAIWPLLERYATAIHTIHVSEQHRFGHARLQSHADEALGHVVEAQHLNHVLASLIDVDSLLAPATLTAFDPDQCMATITTLSSETTVKARLVVAADGADSCMRQFCQLASHIKAYNQHALVANIGLARHHRHIAYERFTASGPLAMLPMMDARASLVWSLRPDDAQHMMHASEHEFLSQLQSTFGYRLGRLVKVGRRTVYPLRQVTMPKLVAGSVIFIGNAAHTLHPVAGQGFNLGLRDVAMLAQCITQYGLNETMLHHYQQSRQHDQTTITRLTDGLVELFTQQRWGLGIARGAGLIALDNSMVLKQILVRYARGFGGIIPDLVCGIPLTNSCLAEVGV